MGGKSHKENSRLSWVHCKFFQKGKKKKKKTNLR